VLCRNGVPEAKITLSRQGIDREPLPERPAPADASGPLKIAYFGRIDRTKGPDLLARALSLLPEADVRICVNGVCQPGSEPDAEWLAQQASLDGRLKLLPAVAQHEVVDAMAAHDIVAIPSRWLETGPLVALEAFAAHVPVLGANHGGIAEIVRDGIDGVLVAPDDPVAWAAAIDRLARDRALLHRLRTGITPPRTADAVADDMADLYGRLLSNFDAPHY
jgi:glycosyltransferase involved in cell wall biosynthesis